MQLNVESQARAYDTRISVHAEEVEHESPSTRLDLEGRSPESSLEKEGKKAASLGESLKLSLLLGSEGSSAIQHSTETLARSDQFYEKHGRGVLGDSLGSFGSLGRSAQSESKQRDVSRDHRQNPLAFGSADANSSEKRLMLSHPSSGASSQNSTLAQGEEKANMLAQEDQYLNNMMSSSINSSSDDSAVLDSASELDGEESTGVLDLDRRTPWAFVNWPWPRAYFAQAEKVDPHAPMENALNVEDVVWDLMYTNAARLFRF